MAEVTPRTVRSSFKSQGFYLPVVMPTIKGEWKQTNEGILFGLAIIMPVLPVDKERFTTYIYHLCCDYVYQPT